MKITTLGRYGLLAMAGLASAGCHQDRVNDVGAAAAPPASAPAPPAVAAPAAPAASAPPAPAPSATVTPAAPSIEVTPAPPTGRASGPCIKLAWTCGSLPDAYDTTKLSGTVGVVTAKNSTGASVRAAKLALDQPVCDPRGKPVATIQIDDEHAKLASKHVTVVLKQFITARSDEVHFLPVIASSEEPDAESVKVSRDHQGEAFLHARADVVEAAAGTPELDLGGSEGEACFLFTCAPHRKVCFNITTEQASWKQVLRAKAPVTTIDPVTEADKDFARKSTTR